MATDLDDWVGYISYHYGQARYWGGRIGDALYNAGSYLRENDLDRAGQSLQACHNYFAYFSDNIVTYNASYGYAVVGALQWISDNWPEAVEPYELDMSAIIIAMLSANPEQVEYFVGLVDAYRQSIWNRPFNKDFYAALARGFMIWP